MFLDGIVLIDKDEKMSSNDLDYQVRRVFKTKKVGHLGTLDPFASGLMIIGVNEGTKILPYINHETKSYISKLKLFEQTETLDNSSEIIKQVPQFQITEDEIIKVLKSFEKTYLQLPPKYSSKSVNGVRAYKLARDNIEFDLTPKKVTIHNINFISYKDNTIEFDCCVSNGTYIRSLGLDIAAKLNTIGHLTYLRRTSIGDYKLTPQTKKYQTLTKDDLIYIKDTKVNFSKYFLSDEEFQKVRYGNPFNLNTIKDEFVMFFYEDNVLFLTKFDKSINKYRILRGFNYEYYRTR